MEETVNIKNEKLKNISNKLIVVVISLITLLGSFAAGIVYHKSTTPVKKGIEMIHVDKSQVNLALDEHNHLIVIDKTTGDYTVYDDSIGVAVFKIYARNVQITK